MKSGAKPGPSSRTWSSTPLPSPSGAEADLARAVAQRVVEQVAERLFEPQLVAAHPQARRRPPPRSSRPRSRGAGRSARAPSLEQLGDLDLLAPQRELAAIEARDHQQVLREPHQPLRLLRGGRERRAQLLGRASAPQRQLQLGLEDAERRAQLVARVGDEAPLAHERRLEAVEHLVQGLAQARDLVAARRAAAAARPARTARSPPPGGASPPPAAGPPRRRRSRRATPAAAPPARRPRAAPRACAGSRRARRARCPTTHDRLPAARHRQRAHAQRRRRARPTGGVLEDHARARARRAARRASSSVGPRPAAWRRSRARGVSTCAKSSPAPLSAAARPERRVRLAHERGDLGRARAEALVDRASRSPPSRR